MSITPGGFSLKLGGWRSLLPEDSTGRINEQQLRDTIYGFHQRINQRDFEGGSRRERPWRRSGLDAMRSSQAWKKMLDAKRHAVSRKNALIDRAERGDENAIKELNDIMARQRNMMTLKRYNPLKKPPRFIEGLRGRMEHSLLR